MVFPGHRSLKIKPQGFRADLSSSTNLVAREQERQLPTSSNRDFNHCRVRLTWITLAFKNAEWRPSETDLAKKSAPKNAAWKSHFSIPQLRAQRKLWPWGPRNGIFLARLVSALEAMPLHWKPRLPRIWCRWPENHLEKPSAETRGKHYTIYI